MHSRRNRPRRFSLRADGGMAANVHRAAETRFYDSEGRMSGYVLSNAVGCGVSVAFAYDGPYLTNAIHTLPCGSRFAARLTRATARTNLVPPPPCPDLRRTVDVLALDGLRSPWPPDEHDRLRMSRSSAASVAVGLASLTDTSSCPAPQRPHTARPTTAPDSSGASASALPRPERTRRPPPSPRRCASASPCRGES